MLELLMLEYMTGIGMTIVQLFLDSRYPRRQTILVFYSTTILIMAAVAGLYWIFGLDAVFRSYPLVVHLPSLLLLLALSRHRGWRLVFQFLSSFLFCVLIQHGAGLIFYLSGNCILALGLAYAVLTAGVIWFLLRFQRPLFLRVLPELRQGWWLMCLVMAVYYGIIFYLIPGYVGFSLPSTILKPAISLLMVGFYWILIYLFSTSRKEAEARHSAQLSALHLSALQSRMEAVKSAEDAVRTQRHDLRHRLQTVTQLVAQGDQETALAFLNAAQRHLDEQKPVRWCKSPVLGAVCASYFDQARQQGIRVEASLSLPEALPTEEAELAIVLANALENAIHANLELPPETRVIRCRAVSSPSVMLEISNPCNGPVTFDDRGLPVARREGHGLGSQSIAAFCQKYGAVCQFNQSDGWFRLRVIL